MIDYADTVAVTAGSAATDDEDMESVLTAVQSLSSAVDSISADTLHSSSPTILAPGYVTKNGVVRKVESLMLLRRLSAGDYIVDEEECEICRETGTLLLCDGCDLGYHHACVGAIPEEVDDLETWFCPGCSPEDNVPAPQKGRKGQAQKGRAKSPGAARKRKSGETVAPDRAPVSLEQQAEMRRSKSGKRKQADAAQSNSPRSQRKAKSGLTEYNPTDAPFRHDLIAQGTLETVSGTTEDLDEFEITATDSTGPKKKAPGDALRAGPASTNARPSGGKQPVRAPSSSGVGASAVNEDDTTSSLGDEEGLVQDFHLPSLEGWDLPN